MRDEYLIMLAAWLIVAAWIGLAAYTSGWLQLRLGWGHWLTAPSALAITTLGAGLFGLIALRAAGLGFLMITLAFGQVLWGTAYRWAAVTNGDLAAVTRDLPPEPPVASQHRQLAVAFLLALLTLAVLGVILAVAR